MTASPIWIGDNSALVEQAESGELTLDAKGTYVQIFEGTRELCYANALSRGVLGSGPTYGMIVSKSQVSPTKGGRARLTITWEAVIDTTSITPGFTLPPDDFDLDPFEINPRAERHSIFRGLTQHQIDVVKTRVNALTAEARTDHQNVIDNEPTSPLMNKLVEKLTRGQETYYLAGLKYTWVLYFYSKPAISRGGVVETPGGPLAGVLPSDFEWLRLCDRLSPVNTNGTYIKLTRSWLGGPSGHWDHDFYQ